MTRAASFAAGVAVTVIASLAGLVTLALFALADTELDQPDQCDATFEPATTGYFGPPLRCQESAGHDGAHRHTENTGATGIVTTWGCAGA